MSESTYKQWLFNQQIKNYWRQKVQANLFSEGLDGSNTKRQIGGESFSRIFGGNTVDIRPQGAAELTFSGNIDKTKNPNLTQNQQSNGSFNFNQSIQMNVIGKIGTKLALRTNYDTESQFDFENQMKLSILVMRMRFKKIELGNVSLPLSGSLIAGTQSLFGIKMQLQFGKATFTTVFSEQKSETSTIRVDGGAQTTNFEIYADDYEANKHYFLAQYFYDNYDLALSNMPIINSNIIITNLEVWVTNRSGVTQNVRNVLAFQDLGEQLSNVYNTTNVYSGSLNIPYPDNRNNVWIPEILVTDFPNIRSVSQITSQLNGTDMNKRLIMRKLKMQKN